MDINDIRSAAERIRRYVKRTPLERSDSLSKRLNTNVYVKYELFQKAGSFKPRGAFNKLLQLSDDEKAKGVVAVSGGNHAQAVAYAASVLGIDAVIAMPENTPATYLNATRSYGATVDLQPTIADAFAKVNEYVAEGRVVVHPFDDEAVIEGQGTVGLEIFEDVPQITDVFASIGGGGMAGGVAFALKSLKPTVRAWGVETVGADAMSQAIAAGEPVTLPAITSIAKTLGAPYVTTRTLDLVRDNMESVTVVSDADAVREILYIAERLKVITEPAAACNVAAAEKLRDNFTPNSHVVIVLCGGNTSIVDASGYLRLLA
ncbi:MAG: threonine/serine dehydratase [Acidobacteria bacterium]|nr:threonine/serine dehydratase [Acidobacteriota bacterium]MBP9110766.1 threonine/serine dehydratase [Pyrinomonadaceae bacterium]